MHFRVERAGGSRSAQRGDGFGMALLPREGHTEVKRGNRIIRIGLKHGAKCALGLRELVLLQVSPTFGEVISLNGTGSKEHVGFVVSRSVVLRESLGHEPSTARATSFHVRIG
jgi:hypothetical protein